MTEPQVETIGCCRCIEKTFNHLPLTKNVQSLTSHIKRHAAATCIWSTNFLYMAVSSSTQVGFRIFSVRIWRDVYTTYFIEIGFEKAELI
jgi:hypothetical protein